MPAALSEPSFLFKLSRMNRLLPGPSRCSPAPFSLLLGCLLLFAGCREDAEPAPTPLPGKGEAVIQVIHPERGPESGYIVKNYLNFDDLQVDRTFAIKSTDSTGAALFTGLQEGENVFLSRVAGSSGVLADTLFVDVNSAGAPDTFQLKLKP